MLANHYSGDWALLDTLNLLSLYFAFSLFDSYKLEYIFSLKVFQKFKWNIHAFVFTGIVILPVLATIFTVLTVP